MAKRFFLPVNVVAVPVKSEVRTNSRGTPVQGDLPDTIVLKGINDTAGPVSISLEVRAVKVGGGDRIVFSGNSAIGPDAAMAITEVPMDELEADEFLFFSWRDAGGKLLGENDFFPKAYKAYEIVPAQVSGSWSDRDGQAVLTLESDNPALFTTATVDIPGYFSDNAVTLLPGRKAELVFTPRHGRRVTSGELAPSLKIRNLSETF
jgi:beta-mannosidase